MYFIILYYVHFIYDYKKLISFLDLFNPIIFIKLTNKPFMGPIVLSMYSQKLACVAYCFEYYKCLVFLDIITYFLCNFRTCFIIQVTYNLASKNTNYYYKNVVLYIHVIYQILMWIKCVQTVAHCKHFS